MMFAMVGSNYCPTRLIRLLTHFVIHSALPNYLLVLALACQLNNIADERQIPVAEGRDQNRELRAIRRVIVEIVGEFPPVDFA